MPENTNKTYSSADRVEIGIRERPDAKAIERAVMEDRRRPCLYGVAGPCYHPKCLESHYRTLRDSSWEQQGEMRIRRYAVIGKFKVWCYDKDEWERDSVYLSKNGTPLHYLHGDLQALRSSTHKVLFFTGRCDKNGKELYDGDICNMIIQVSNEHQIVPSAAHRVVIEMQGSAWGFRHLFPELVHPDDREWRSFWRDEDREEWKEEWFNFIGNCYSNPELLRT